MKIKPKTNEEFITKASIVHSNKYLYTKTKYINSKTKVIITCKTHGDFEQAPYSHIQGSGCYLCSLMKRGKTRLSYDEVIRRSNTIHCNSYSYSNFNYSDCHDKMKILCDKHGYFEQRILDHLQGQGCPCCATTGFKKNKPSYLYLFSVSGADNFCKFGITNDYDKRIKQHKRNLLKYGMVIENEIIFKIDGHQARYLENSILTQLKSYDTGITGFQKEAVKDDYELVYDIVCKTIEDLL